MRESANSFRAKHEGDTPMELYVLRDDIRYSIQRLRMRIDRDPSGKEERLLRGSVARLSEYKDAIDSLVRSCEQAGGEVYSYFGHRGPLLPVYV